jgi:hypothetical protein
MKLRHRIFIFAALTALALIISFVSTYEQKPITRKAASPSVPQAHVIFADDQHTT